MLMPSVITVKVASPAHVQRAMREMEPTAAEVHRFVNTFFFYVGWEGLNWLEANANNVL